jgi:hypothetical protein
MPGVLQVVFGILQRMNRCLNLGMALTLSG